MIQFNPTIIVKHLIVMKSDSIVYNEEFHHGLNVLYGSNGGGKTSIMQLLVYALGYDVKDWKVEAVSCDYVYCEVDLNGSIITFRRKIKDTGQQSLQICFMKLVQAIDTSNDNWKEYPYKISSAKESFSQKIFDLLGMPEIKFDDSGSNVTLHQIFRLIYSDQSNPAKYILNNESWDSALKREIIGNYLLGIHDDELFDAKIKLNKFEKEFDKLNSELRAMHNILKKSDIIDDSDDVQACLDDLSDENKKVYKQIDDIKKNQLLEYSKENETINTLTKQNIELKHQLFEKESEINNLTYEIEDSKLFINELENKLRDIIDSIETKQIVSNIPFEICPSCFSKIKNISTDECNLCGKKSPEKKININLLRMKNELQLQLKESLILLEKKEDNLEKDKRILKKYKAELKKNILSLAPSYSSINTSREKELFDLYQKVGENKERIETYGKLHSLYNEVKRLTKETKEKEESVEKYKKLVTSNEAIAKTREHELKLLISEIMCRLLKKDTTAESNEELEEKFKTARKVEYDFASNAIIVDGQSTFSESSMYLLNNLFHVAILIASTEKEYIRFPRLLILDGIENGGMSDARSRNFQKIIKEETDSIKCKFQIIIATRSIYPELENSKYQVGNKLTSSSKSLKV